MVSLVKLSENDKRVIIALLLLIIILFILFGYLVKFIKHLMDKYGRGIDTYVAEMLNYNILTKPKEIRKYVRKRENNLLFKKLAIPTYVFLAIAILFSILGDFNQIGEVLNSLAFKINWPRRENFFGIKNFPIDWPSVNSPTPILTMEAWLIYAFSLTSLVYVFILCRRTLIFFSRILRANKKSRAVFAKSLDNVSLEQY